jgi:O-antigen/teichoic acid export membrane protein
LINRILNTFGTRLATALINFGIAVVISQYLGAEGKGEQGILITSIALIIVFSSIAGGASTIYLAPRYNIKLLLLPSYLWSVFISALSCLIIWVFHLVQQDEYILHLGILSVLASYISVHTSLLIGKGKIILNNLVNLLQSFIIIVSLIFLFGVFGRTSIQTYIISLYISFIITLVVSFSFIFPYIKRSAKFRFREQAETLKIIFKYGAINQTALVFHLFSFRISYYILEAISGSKPLGIYSNAVSIIESVWLVSGSIAIILYSRISNTEDKKYAQVLTAGMAKVSIFAGFVLVLPLTLLPSELFSFMFGREFAGIHQLIIILAPGIIIYNYSVIIVNYFSGTGKFHINMISSAIGMLLTIILSLVLVPKFSSVGTAITASISYIAASVFLIYVFLKESHLRVIDIIPTPSFINENWNKMRLQMKSWFLKSGNSNEK